MIFQSEPVKQIELQLSEKTFSTHQFLDHNFWNASYFESIFYNALIFELKISQRFRIWPKQ